MPTAGSLPLDFIIISVCKNRRHQRFFFLLWCRFYFFKNVLFFFFFFTVCVVQIFTDIPSSISSEERERTCTFDKKKKDLKFYSFSLSFCVYRKKKCRENFDSSNILIHLKSFCVCFTSSYINVKKRRRRRIKQRRKTDGSSDHRDKKVVCVCVRLF